MYNLAKFFFYFLLLDLLPVRAGALPSADPIQFYFQQMDNRNGLSNSAVNVVFQDKDQLVWVGTWDGLNMYDGTDFKVFNYNRENQHQSIGNNVIQDIKEDKRGNIWISTIGGITRFEKSNGRFYRYFYNLNNKSKIAEKEYALAIDSSGNVFCYSKTGGLSRFNTATNQFEAIALPRMMKFIKMEADKNGQLWFLNDLGSLIVAKVAASRLHILRQHSAVGATNFFLSNNHLFLADVRDIHITDFWFKTIRKISNQNKIKALTYYKANYIIAWETQGISTYDETFKPSDLLDLQLRELSGTKIISLNSARNDVLWIGTDGKGLIKIYPRNNYFGLVNKAGAYNLDKPVRTFTEENGNLWIGTKGQGILKIHNFWKTNAEETKTSLLNTGNGLENNAVFSLYKGSNSYVYIGTDGPGINIYDLRSGKNIWWKDIKGTASVPAFGSVYAIIQDPDSTLWLGTSGSGLIKLRLKKQKSGALELSHFKQYLSGSNTGPANDIIYALADGQDGKLWIACRYGGLSLLDKKTGLFKTFKAFAYKNSLSNNDVLSLYLDHQKNLWIGTSYGLNCLRTTEASKAQPNFIKFTMEQGLPNNTIHAITESPLGTLWFSTNKGMAKLDQQSKAIASFMESDGLQSNEFSDGAVWKSENGYLFFGGIYGFNYFNPQKIKGTNLQPNLLVTSFQMGGKTVNENKILVLSSDQTNAPAYILERKSNFFRISIKSMSYLNPAKNEFSYKLEGLDKSWNYSGALGQINYNNIPPGNYTLLVKWSNGEGRWTKAVKIFELRVNQYFWLTYPALFIYLIVLLISGYVFHLYRKNKLRMKYQLEVEHLLRQKDESQHQQRLNFFTNIAHEIQTPLTMIMGSVEHFMQSKKNGSLKTGESHYFLSMVHQHTVRLSYLVQQLMEFRKAEAGYLQRKDDYVDISKMLTSLSALFIQERDVKQQVYLREIAEGMAGFIDKDKLEKIIFNLLSNAFKHSGPEDTIIFEASFNQESNVLSIGVSNLGCHLNQSDLDQLFDRFFAGAQQKFSTGIGLAFSRELALLLGAEIKVRMEADWIHFNLNIPMKVLSANQEAEIIPSTPSIAFNSLLARYPQPSAEEENKNSLINDLHENKKASILLVEDEPELRYLLRNILKEHYVVYESGSGTEALLFLRKTIPDLIISDIMMPDMDGLQLCQQVKNTPALMQVLFILLSARGALEHKTEGYEVGADAYIPKPFHISYLLVRIKKLLDAQHKMQDLIKDQHIGSQFIDAGLAETDKKFLEILLKAIEENLDEPELNSAKLEEVLSISKMQLYRRLKSLTGMTPAEFIKRIRLKHAADMLISSQYTVSEIFYRTGFNNKSYFFREFRKIYHCAPNEYRLQQHEVKPSVL